MRVDPLVEELVNHLRNALSTSHRGFASLAVCGGTTPGELYARLARADLDWSKVMITTIDERIVPHDHPHSNIRMIGAYFSRAKLVPLWQPDDVDVGDKIEFTSAHKRMEALRPFDVVIVAVGEDGHIASIFPSENGTYFAEEREPGWQPKLFGVQKTGNPPCERISMNIAMLLDSTVTYLLIANAARAQLIESGHKMIPANHLAGQKHIHPVHLYRDD